MRLALSVEYPISRGQWERRQQMLDAWQGYTAPNGSKPFETYTLEQMFQMIMTLGAAEIVERQLEDWEGCEYLSRLKTFGKTEPLTDSAVRSFGD